MKSPTSINSEETLKPEMLCPTTDSSAPLFSYSITDVEVHSFDNIDVRVDIKIDSTTQNLLFQTHHSKMILSVGLGHRQDEEIEALASIIRTKYSYEGMDDMEDHDVLHAYLAMSGVMEAVQDAADKVADDEDDEDDEDDTHSQVLVWPRSAFGGVSFRLAQTDEGFVVQSDEKGTWRTVFEVSEETADSIVERYSEPGYDDPAIIAHAERLDSLAD